MEGDEKEGKAGGKERHRAWEEGVTKRKAL